MPTRPRNLPGLLAWALATVACVPEDPPGGVRRAVSKSGSEPRLGSSGAALRLPAAVRRSPNSARSSRPLPIGIPVTSAIEQPFEDDFERPSLGARYLATSSVWRINEGRLCGQGAHNHPVWLSLRLPTNARIEFDAISHSHDGDIKVEAWGDGISRAITNSYTNATSYIFVLGGWSNTLHVLARLDEHGADRKELRLDPEADDPRTAPLEPGRIYHFRIERKDGRTLRFSVNDVEILNLSDPRPLTGSGHEHFAFNNWKTRVCFDNLHILPLGD